MEVLVLDVETTGLIDSRLKQLKFQPHVIQFCCVMMDLDTEEKIYQYDTFIRPPVKELLTDKITEVTRITWEVLERHEVFATYANKIQALIREAPAVAAHNLPFDRDMLDLEARRLGQEWKWPERQICTIELTNHMAGFRLNLGSLYRLMFAKSFEEAHDARADVGALCECLVEMRRKDWL